jgi:hypothetical protein
MSTQIRTYEATVEGGRIRLPDEVHLPENTRVYVVVPGIEITSARPLISPRLTNRTQAADFVKEVSEEDVEAGV